MQEATQRARSGGGPTLIEALTYRRGGHKRDDPATYRPQEEVDAWLAQDPIELFRARLAADPRFGESLLERMDKEVASLLDDAVEFAQSSPNPPTSLALEHLYA
jgi:pyruvate dehydrogenase E1 component alpha subunit